MIITFSENGDEVENSMSFNRQRSKAGCLTCKIRKKRCDEQQPKCGDCTRLHKKCVYISQDLDIEVVRSLKEQVRQEEQHCKIRNRRKKVPKVEQDVSVTNHDSQQVLRTPTSLSPVNFTAPNSPVTPNRWWLSPSLDPLLLSDLGEHFSIPPSINVCHELDPLGSHLYNYYKDKLASVMSVVSPEENFFLKAFLPMAQVDRGVMSGILAWSGFHLGGSAYFEAGTRFMSEALQHIKENPVKNSSSPFSLDDRINMRLATFLILCGAEICRGSVKQWTKHLEHAADLIKESGGIVNFARSNDQHWLVTNFAYHDILRGFVNSRKIEPVEGNSGAMHFSTDDYNKVINVPHYGLDPLHGISKPLFQIIGEIGSLAVRAKRLLKYATENTEDSDDAPTRNVALKWILQESKLLEKKIDSVRPTRQDLSALSSQDLEIQLTLFESFQLTCKLHIQCSVLQLTPCSICIQLLTSGLMKRLSILLGSSVESCLCFPLFITGLNCVSIKDRNTVLLHYKEYIDRYKWKNVERAKSVTEKIWLMNEKGNAFIDWYDVLDQLGWDLSFA